MEWLRHMNDALAYMEDNLAGEISVAQAARLACSTQYHFQRMFSYIIGVPLSEYLRRRRLTQAALDLQLGDKVLDVAMRYGYESPTAFNRAFQAVHGVPPSAARKPDTVLKAYPRVSFQITVKGVEEMDYRIVKKEAFRVVGVRMPISIDAEESFKSVPPFWQQAFESGVVPRILALMDAEPKGLLGVSVYDEDSDAHFYYIAVAVKPQQDVPDGMYACVVPEGTWAVFPGAGSPGSIQDLQKRIFSEWLPTSGYRWAESADVEVYLDSDPTHMRYEVWLPLVKE